MGFKSEILHIPMTDAGFNYSRNYELIPDTGLIDPSTNFNLHNLGVELRGGTSIVQAKTVNKKIMGGYDFRQSTGNQNMVYAKADGKVYVNNDSTVIASGMSISNYFNFSQYYDSLYICDGSTVPKVWNGGGMATNVTPPSDWALSGYPFQIVFHPRGASFRNWAITSKGVYASKVNDGSDFSDANVIFIPVYSKGGLVAGFEFGQQLFVCSKTEDFLIDDSNASPTQWGYTKAIWEGGAAHWRLISIADNDVYIMTDDLTIYSLQGVFQTGNYRKASVSRPAQIDRYLREVSTFDNINNWHCAYDPKIRCVKWFVQVGGNNTNTALVQFIDKPADKAWAIHGNSKYASGYNVSASWTTRKSTSDWRIRTGDYSGNVWELEQLARNDNNNPIPAVIKTKPIDFGNSVMHKRFNKGVLRLRSGTNVNLTVSVWIDNVRMPDQSVSVTSSGAIFDLSKWDECFFSGDVLSRTPFDIKKFGKTLQVQLTFSSLNQDFFLSELLAAFKENGVRVYA